MTHKSLEAFILNLPDTWLDYPFGAQAAVYKVGEGDKAKMFALVGEGNDPVRISLKCDPLLAQTLRDKYESVQPGYHLNKKHWNTIVCSGQLSEQEVRDLIIHSYGLVTGAKDAAPSGA